jgi:hypothetical protein
MHPDFSLDCMLFDLDGTLLDTAPDLISSLNYALKAEGLKEILGPSSNTKRKPTTPNCSLTPPDTRSPMNSATTPFNCSVCKTSTRGRTVGRFTGRESTVGSGTSGKRVWLAEQAARTPKPRKTLIFMLPF